jgi:ribosomal protein L16/L10AE
MGKGKGAISEKVAIVKIGQIFARLKIIKSKK